MLNIFVSFSLQAPYRARASWPPMGPASTEAHLPQMQNSNPRKGGFPSIFCEANSAAKAQARNQRLVTLGVGLLHVIEQTTAL